VTTQLQFVIIIIIIIIIDSTQTVGNWGTAIADSSTCDALVSSVSDSHRAASLISWRCCGEMGLTSDLKQEQAFSMVN
jgi:hypothetical protein